jgi:hypothetical protein
MTSTLTESRPRAARPPVENRVVGLGGFTASTTSATWSQVIETHQETADTSTWTASEVGNWLSKDPIGISGGLNQYVAFANNPVNFIDPFGLEELTCRDKAMISIVEKYFPKAFKNQTEMTGYIRKNPKTGECEEGVSKQYPWSPNRAITVGTQRNAPPPGHHTVPDATAVWHFHVMPRAEGVSQGLSRGDRGWARDIKRWTGGRVDAWYLAVPSGENINVYRWDIQPIYRESDMVPIGTVPLPGGR